jgi:hypothetical protein
LSNGDKVEVDREHIVDLFGEGFAAKVELRGMNGHRSKKPYIDVPVGACRIPHLEYFSFLVRPNAPTVRFPQGKHDMCIYSFPLHLPCIFVVPGLPRIISSMWRFEILAATNVLYLGDWRYE